MTALGVITSAVWALATPQIETIAEALIETKIGSFTESIEKNSGQLEQLSQSVGTLQESIEMLSSTALLDQSPAWRWSRPDTYFSDAAVGEELIITASGYKLRDCGVPIIDLYFEDSSRRYHRLKANTFLSSGNRGIALPVYPTVVQTISYPAMIPSDDEVALGRADGYIAITYPDRCPHLEAATVGPIPFTILP